LTPGLLSSELLQKKTSESSISSISLVSIQVDSPLYVFDESHSIPALDSTGDERWSDKEPLPYIFSLINSKTIFNDITPLSTCWIVYPEPNSTCYSSVMTMLISHQSDIVPTCYPSWNANSKSEQNFPKPSHVSILRYFQFILGILRNNLNPSVGVLLR
jgi:hypothetical protein